MKRIAVLTLAASAMALSACASLAPYGPQRGPNGQGFIEQRIESDRFRVTYNGVGAPGPVADYALLRAAEVTTENGYDWFATVNRATERDTRFYSTPDPFYDRFYGPRFGPYWSPSWRFYRRGYWSPWGPTWGNDFDVRQVDRYEANAEIILGRGPKPAGDPNAFDAREVIQNLGPRVTRPMP